MIFVAILYVLRKEEMIMSIFERFSLKGKTALVTGGGSGIGAASAMTLASAGAKVMIVGRRKEKLEQVRDDIIREGGKCSIYPCDISSEVACKEVIEHFVSEFKTMDILVNSAGTAGTANLGTAVGGY